MAFADFLRWFCRPCRAAVGSGPAGNSRQQHSGHGPAPSSVKRATPVALAAKPLAAVCLTPQGGGTLAASAVCSSCSPLQMPLAPSWRTGGPAAAASARRTSACACACVHGCILHRRVLQSAQQRPRSSAPYPTYSRVTCVVLAAGTCIYSQADELAAGARRAACRERAVAGASAGAYARPAGGMLHTLRGSVLPSFSF